MTARTIGCDETAITITVETLAIYDETGDEETDWCDGWCGCQGQYSRVSERFTLSGKLVAPRWVAWLCSTCRLDPSAIACAYPKTPADLGNAQSHAETFGSR